MTQIVSVILTIQADGAPCLCCDWRVAFSPPNT
jgi:hypothetical protein